MFTKDVNMDWPDKIAIARILCWTMYEEENGTGSDTCR